MTKIELINSAFEMAEHFQSKLAPECFEIGGYTSNRIRHLMNNLGSISTNYLEIGCLKGSLSVATTYRNDINSTFCDNWSEFKEEGNKEEFHENYRRFFEETQLCGMGKGAMIIEQDCFTLNTSELKGPFDLYLYDADHGLEAQEKAITHFLPAMADEFILCVDDSDWTDVKVGTAYGIDGSKLKVVQSWIKTAEDGYHNGFSVFLLNK